MSLVDETLIHGRTAIDRALDAYSQGRLDEAAAICRLVLNAEPRNVDALQTLGVVALAQKEFDRARAFFDRAIEADPSNPMSHNNRGVAARACGRLDAAIDAFARAAVMSPQFAGARYNLGLACEAKGRLDDARDAIEVALAVEPNAAEALHALGRVLTTQGQLDAGVAAYRRAIAVRPDFAEAHYNLGNAFCRRNEWTTAEASFRTAASLAPHVARIHNNLGDALKEQKRHDEALDCFERAVALDPQLAEARNNRASILQFVGRWDEAETELRRALELNPRFDGALTNLANVCTLMRRFDEALDLLNRAIDVAPNSPEARFNRALLLLGRGDFERGWPEYEWRFARKVARRNFREPSWDGSPLAGRTLLVYAEQGVGDEIMFASCIDELREIGGRIVIECEPRLVPLFARSFPWAEVVARPAATGDEGRVSPATDLQIPMGTLPRFFRTRLEAFPKQPYLVACPHRISAWRNRLAQLGGSLVAGIAWAGGVEPDLRRLRSTSLAQWRSIFDVAGVTFVNLQHGADAQAAKGEHPRLHTFAEVDPLRDLDEFAALVAACDLVISVDNSTVHLAGALGVECWTLLPFSADWRWGEHPTEANWYRSVRLFRQPAVDAWEPVFQSVATELTRRAENVPPSIACQLAAANGHYRSGRLQEACVLYRQILVDHTANFDALNNLAAALQDLGNVEEAIAVYRRAAMLAPRRPEIVSNLASALRSAGRLEEAIAAYEFALTLQPGYAVAHYNLGNCLKDCGRIERARIAYLSAALLDSQFAEPHVQLAVLAQADADAHAACHHLDEAIARKPSGRLRIQAATILPPIYESHADLLARRTRFETNVAALVADGVCIDAARETVDPPFYLAYQGQSDRALQRELARLYRSSHMGPPKRQRPRGRKVRVGFISRYFGNHTIGRLMKGVITGLSRRDFEVFVIDVVPRTDEISREIHASADATFATGENIPVALRRVAEASLDVLFFTDLGMDPVTWTLAHSRLAPVQCTTWGHPLTTGLDAIDAFVSSRLFEPPDAEAHYTERLIRLDGIGTCYAMPREVKSVRTCADFRLPDDRHLYGCPQSLFKLHPDFDAVLGEILRRDPDGEIVLLSGRSAAWNERLLRRLRAAIPDAAHRIRFTPRVGYDDFLALNRVFDVLLDPIHYSGGNTSLEALAFGAPIVTLPSPYLRGRITAGLYGRMGMSDAISTSTEDYIERAVRLGTDRQERAALSRRILESHSVLFDDAHSIREIEAALHSLIG